MSESCLVRWLSLVVSLLSNKSQNSLKSESVAIIIFNNPLPLESFFCCQRFFSRIFFQKYYIYLLSMYFTFLVQSVKIEKCISFNKLFTPACKWFMKFNPFIQIRLIR